MVDMLQNDIAPLPSGNTVEGSTLFIRVLSFLDEMAKDQVLDICFFFLLYVSAFLKFCGSLFFQIRLKSKPKNPPSFKEKVQTLI